jgi:hypothetical protein
MQAAALPLAAELPLDVASLFLRGKWSFLQVFYKTEV